MSWRWSKRRPPKAAPSIVEIYELLSRLGVTANYTGFFYASYAVYLAARQPERLLLVTKWLYPEVAKRYATTWECVERDIRTIIRVAWDTHPAMLEQVTRHPLSRRPKTSKFLATLALSFSFEPPVQ